MGRSIRNMYSSIIMFSRMANVFLSKEYDWIVNFFR